MTGHKDKVVLERVGQTVKRMRSLRGKTQRMLAAEVGVSQNHLSNIEGGNREPGILLLLRISRALAVPVELLLLPAMEPSEEVEETKARLGRDLQDLVISILTTVDEER